MSRVGLVVALVTVGLAKTAFAAEVAVFPVIGTNIEQGEMDAIGAMIAEGYAMRSRRSVLGPDKTGKAAADSAGNLSAAARALGVYQYIQIRAVKLTSKTSLHVTLHNADGSQVHGVSVYANTLDDLEPVSDRVARSLVNRLPLDETQTIDDVTINETKARNRTFVEKVLGIKTVVSWPVDFTHRYEPSVGLMFDGRLEGKQYFLEFGVGFLIPPSLGDAERHAEIGGLIAEIGASYYLAHTSVSPYIGGGITPRLIALDHALYSGEGHAGANVALYAQAGLMFMRESSSRVYVDFRIGQNVMPLRYSGYCDSYEVSYGECRNTGRGSYYPLELGLEAGIGW
jgi:hypothetical protein